MCVAVIRVPIFQVDAFAARRFGGNSAAVMVLPEFLDDAVLQAVARENNLTETAFLVRDGSDWQLRWFTPTVEVPLCGHATLASAWVVCERLVPGSREVAFHTVSGVLTVRRSHDRFVMDFPARPNVAARWCRRRDRHRGRRLGLRLHQSLFCTRQGHRRRPRHRGPTLCSGTLLVGASRKDGNPRVSSVGPRRRNALPVQRRAGRSRGRVHLLHGRRSRDLNGRNRVQQLVVVDDPTARKYLLAHEREPQRLEDSLRPEIATLDVGTYSCQSEFAEADRRRMLALPLTRGRAPNTAARNSIRDERCRGCRRGRRIRRTGFRL